MPFYECTIATPDGASIECDVSVRPADKAGVYNARVYHGTSVGGDAPIIPALVDARFPVTPDHADLDVESHAFENLVKANLEGLLPPGAVVRRFARRPGLM